MTNYYKILEVKPDANEKEIKTAYAKKIRKFPVEKYPDQSVLINEAYEVLSDPVRRKEFDAMFNHGDKIDKYEIDAERALDNEDFKTAIELYKRILELEPEWAPIKHKMAVALLRNEQGNLAISEIKEAISLDPKNPLYYFDMARIYRTLGNNNRAEKSYLNAYKLDENNYNIIEAITDFYTDNKRYDSAVSFLEKCTGKDSDNLFRDFSYLMEMINVYVRSNDADNINKIKKIVDRIKEITPENKQKDVALKFVDLVGDACEFENEKIIKTLCDSVLEFDKDNEKIKEFLKKFEEEESKPEEATRSQTKNQSNSRQEQEKPVYNMNNTSIPISNLDQIKTIIIGCIGLVICGVLGLPLGIGVIMWLFIIVPLVRKYNIEKHNKYNIPKLSLAHKLLGYVIIMGTCIFNVEGNIIGGRTEDSRMVWGYVLGYAGFCLLLHYFPGLGITKNSGTKIKTKKIELLFEEIVDTITGFFKNKSSSFNASAEAYNRQPNESYVGNEDDEDDDEQENETEVSYQNKRKPQKNEKSNNISHKKVLIALLIIVAVIAAPTIGYIAASKLQENNTQASSKNSLDIQNSVTDFDVSTSNELKYVGDKAVINIDKIYPSNINKNQVKVSVNSDASNVVVASDTNLFAVGEGKATITVYIDDIKKSLSFNIIKDKKDTAKQNNYLRKESDSTYLTSESIYNLSNEELLFIKNEIYARHGYIFTEQPYKTYFNSQNWYNGTKKVVSESELNKYEMNNITLIDEILKFKQLKSNNNPINNNTTNNNLINPNPNSNEFICKNIDSIYLSNNDLSKLSRDGLAMLRNEVYARRGYIFKEEPYKSYFNNKTWYRGTINNVPDEMLNPYEFANVKLIQKLEGNN